MNFLQAIKERLKEQANKVSALHAPLLAVDLVKRNILGESQALFFYSKPQREYFLLREKEELQTTGSVYVFPECLQVKEMRDLKEGELFIFADRITKINKVNCYGLNPFGVFKVEENDGAYVRHYTVAAFKNPYTRKLSEEMPEGIDNFHITVIPKGQKISSHPAVGNLYFLGEESKSSKVLVLSDEFFNLLVEKIKGEKLVRFYPIVNENEQ